MKKQQGMTLIELLIASVILSSLILASTWAYSFFSSYWQRLSSQDLVVMRRGVMWQELRRVLSGINNYPVTNSSLRTGFYFIGSPSSLLSVTSSSLLFPGKTAVLQISLKKNEQNTWVLIYEESPLTSFLPLDGISYPKEFDYIKTFELLGDNYSIEYLGWPRHVDIPDESNYEFNIRKATWANNYDGMKNYSFPTGLRISFTDNNGSHNYVFKLGDILIDFLMTPNGADA